MEPNSPTLESTTAALDALDPTLTAFSQNLWHFPDFECEEPQNQLTVGAAHQMQGNGDPQVFPETSAECEAPINLILCRSVEIEADPEIQPSFTEASIASLAELGAETEMEAEFILKWKTFPTI